MRTKKKYLAVLFIICMLAGCIGAPEGTVQKEVTNLILNGGFEEGTDDTPSQWSIEASPSPRLKMYQDYNVSHSGEASITIVNYDEENNAVNSWQQRITEFPVNKKLTLSGYIKTKNVNQGGIVALGLSIEDEVGEWIASATTPLTDLFVGTYDWTEVKTEVFVPSDAKEIRITAYLKGTGQAWFDDIQLIVREGASTLAEGTNLLQNSDFEEVTGDVPFPWIIVTGLCPELIDLYWDKTVSYHGQASISIINHIDSTPGPIVWGQLITEFPINKKLRLSAYIKTENVDGSVGICMRAEDGECGFVGFATTQDKYEFKGTHNWTEVKTSIVVPPEAKVIRIMAFLVGTGQVWFDDIQLIVGEEAEPEPLPQFSQGMEGPGIAHAQGRFQITTQQDADTPRIAFPIPLAFEDQVPIYFEIRTNPENAIKETVIKARDEYNWIAELTFNPLKKGNTVEISWDCYVFIRDHDYSQLPDDVELPKENELPEEILPWLDSTVCVQVDHPEIQEKAREIRGESTNIIEIVQKTANFLETGITRGEFRSLDAVEALHKGGSCTSFANLAAALLRANGIPTRILAVYPTWAPSLQTHYIVEFHVSGYGWVRFESTLGKVPWQSYQDIVVTVVTPEDEDRSFEQPRWAMLGVPWFSLTENLSDYTMLWKGMVDPKMNCDHGAEAMIVFDGEEEKIEEAFNLTLKIWNKYLEIITEGQEVPQALVAQRAAVDSTTLEGYIQKMKEAEAIYMGIE